MAWLRASRFAMTRSWGMVLLAIWLILTGLMPLVDVHFARSELLLAIVAIVAGVLILFQR